MHLWILFKTRGIFRRFLLLIHPFLLVSPSEGEELAKWISGVSSRVIESGSLAILSRASGKVNREYFIVSRSAGHLIWKESDAHPLAHPPIYSRPDAIEVDSNISVVHATDFGSSLCKSRIRTAPHPPSSSPLDPFEGSRTFEHEYPSIQPIMFSRSYPDIARGIKT